MQIPLIALCAVLFVTGPEAEAAKAPVERAPGKVTLAQCLVSLIEEAQVPAQEAGILVDLTAREGQQVAAGEKLARIDDAQTVNAQQIATLKLQVSQERAGNNINVRFAQASSDVARVEYEQAWRANQKTPGTFSESEIRRLGLSDRRAVLAIEQAALDLRVAGLEAKVQEAELAAATNGVQRRQINSPLDGTVVKVNRHTGEWVQPGDFVIHVVRMDHLKIEGFLPATDRADRDDRATVRGYLPSQIDQRPVTVTVEMAGGRRESFEGKVAFVSPLVQAGGVYRFWVEVVNRKEGNHWLLLPGLMAELTIHLQGP